MLTLLNHDFRYWYNTCEYITNNLMTYISQYAIAESQNSRSSVSLEIMLRIHHRLKPFAYISRLNGKRSCENP